MIDHSHEATAEVPRPGVAASPLYHDDTTAEITRASDRPRLNPRAATNPSGRRGVVTNHSAEQNASIDEWAPMAFIEAGAHLVALEELLQLQALDDELQARIAALELCKQEHQELLQNIAQMREDARREGYAQGLRDLIEQQRTAHLNFEEHYAALLQESALKIQRATSAIFIDALRGSPEEFAALIVAQAFPEGRRFLGLRIRIPALDALARLLRAHQTHTPELIIELDPNLHDRAIIDHDAGRIVCDAASLLDALSSPSAPELHQ